MKIGAVWVEIPELEPNELDARYIAKLAFEACEAGKYGQKQLTETICRAIVIVTIAPVKESMIYDYDWDIHQETFIEEQETNFIEHAVVEMEEYIYRRLTHKRKKERFMRTSIEDMKLSAVLVYIMSLQELFERFIEEKMALEYEAPG